MVSRFIYRCGVEYRVKRKITLFKDREEMELWEEFIKYNRIKYTFLLIIGFLLGFITSIIIKVI